MITESNLIGLPVLKENYEFLNYEIKDIIYCVEDLCLVGLYLQKLNSSKEIKVLSFLKIKDIKDEGILIESMEDIVNIDQIQNLDKNNKVLIGYEIHSDKGDIIGTVKDVLLQIKSGKILGLIIGEGIFDDLVKGYSFLPLTKNIDFNKRKIILTEQEQLKILNQKGGLKKILGIYNEN